MNRFIVLSLVTITGFQVNAQSLEGDRVANSALTYNRKLYSTKFKSSNYSEELAGSGGRTFGYLDDYVTLGTVQTITGGKTFDADAKFLKPVTVGLMQNLAEEINDLPAPQLRVGNAWMWDEDVMEGSQYIAMGADPIDSYLYIQGWFQPASPAFGYLAKRPIQINPFGGSATVGPVWIQDAYYSQFSIQGEPGRSVFKAFTPDYSTAFEIAQNGNVFARSLTLSGLANINTGANMDNTALVITGSEPDIVFDQTKANGFSTFTWKRDGANRLAFGMSNTDDFYLTRNVNGTWNDNTLRVLRNTGNVLINNTADNGVDKLQVNGSIEAKGMRLSEGNDLKLIGLGNDSGDLVFAHQDGSEMGRILYDPSNQLLVRFGSNSPFNTLWHSGNLNPASYLANGSSGLWKLASSSAGTTVSTASLELRESNYGLQTASSPRLGFHWGNVAASQIAIEASGRIAVLNNPGTSYESFVAKDITSTGRIYVNEIAIQNLDGGDDSDPYRLRKVQGSSNNNWLELQLNDDYDESFRIYGNSCVGHNCGEYSSNLYHSFDASGNAFHSGRLGVGTLSPSTKLTVEENGNSVQWFGRITSKNTASDASVFIGTTGFGWSVLAAHNAALDAWKPLYLNTFNGSDGANVIVGAGNVGIGTTNPGFKLDVAGNLKVASSNGYMLIDNIGSGENYFNANAFQAFQIGGVEKMRIGINGLNISGNIVTKGIKVSPESVPDYVFKPEYKLRPLSEVEAFVKANSHLPEVPSEAEVKKNGLELGEMSVTLLKKVEELTLYLIELKKENEAQQQEINQLKAARKTKPARR